jgi:glycosyltransferase involved in cell wall biosynthesis
MSKQPFLKRKIQPTLGECTEVQNKHTIVACIPAFDEEATIAKVIVKARKHADKIIVVDDGSKDDTALIAEGLGAVVVKHERNLGYGAAIRSCFSAARDLKADVLVTLDADWQHDPDQIPRLVEPVRAALADIVVGSRFLKESDKTRAPRYRQAGIRVLTRFTEAASHTQFTDAQSGFRAYSRKALEQIMPTEQGMGVSVEILMKAVEHKLRILEVPASVGYGGPGTSTHNPFYHGLDVLASVIKFTSIRHPLLFYGGLSAVALAVSLAFGVWAIELYSKTGVLVTNITLISIAFGLVGLLAFFTAVILFTLISVMREKT